MTFLIDESLHWTDHYVKHGFCVIKGLVSKEYCRKAIAAYQRELGTTLPPGEWTAATLQRDDRNGRITIGKGAKEVLDSVYAEPRLRGAIDTMFGSPDRWTGEALCSPFLCVYRSGNEAVLKPTGHIDFTQPPVPILGSGFGFQVSLVNSEPFSGNITIYPGIHAIVQKYILDHPGFIYADEGPAHEEWLSFVPRVEPYEFVAQEGDVLFFHHLVGHNGNVNAAGNRMPRVTIHGLVDCKEWPNKIDPDAPNLSPWERSLALNGQIELPYDEREVITEARRATAAAAAK